MAELSELFKRYKQTASENNIILYGTALSDSVNGEVLVRFDSPEDQNDSVDGAVIFNDEEDTADTINEDFEADELGSGDSDGDIDPDETTYYSPESDETLTEDGDTL